METNTNVNPEMKSKVAKRAVDFLIFLFEFKPNPVIKEIYPGTRGKTQGERKEIIPALKEIKIAINKEPCTTVFILQPS